MRYRVKSDISTDCGYRLCQVFAPISLTCYIGPMIKEKPKPLLVRFYKHQRSFIKKNAKANYLKEAAYIRLLIDEEKIRHESFGLTV